MGGPRIAYCLQAAGLGLLFVSVISLSDRHMFPVTLNVLQNQSSPCVFPDSLHAKIKSVTPFPEFLVLHRKDVINTDAPAYVIKRRANGAVYFSQTGSHRKESAAYQNPENGAAFLLKCTLTGLEIAGTLYIEGRKYRVSRVYAADKSRSAHNSARDPRGDYYEFLLVQDIPHNDQHVQAHVKRRTRGKQHGDPLLQGAHSLTVPRSRAKRETKDYFIDVLVVLDFAFYKYWLVQADGNSTDAIQKAKEYIAYIFNGINSRFNSAKTADYNLHMTIGSFIIAQTADDAPWTETAKQTTASGVTQLNANTVMTKLETYVKENYSNLPSHDHLMLITEYDLYGDDNGFRFNNTAGFAFIGTMCNTEGQSISVVEDHGGFQSEGTATHELGHSMGAEHDGDGNQCSSADRYVMAGGVHAETDATKANPWLFSPCSVAYFKQRIQDLIRDGYESTCLLSHVTADGVPTVSGLPGQLAGPDVQCRQIYGSQSYLCRGTSFGKAEDVCSAMFCRNPSTQSSCTLNTAAAGTCCGNGKWCSGGQCVSSDKANCYMSDTCPFGQREGPVYQNKTCEEMDSAHCYADNFRQVCCLMCDNARTGVVGCEFGDTVMACDAQFCGRTLQSGELYDAQCCGTCSFTPTTLTPVVTSPDTTPVTEAQSTENACRDTVLVNGTETCPDFLDRAGVLYCCQSQIRDSCCKSCAARKSSDPLCPYGDCTNCKNVETRPVPCSQSLRKSCCKTCNDVDERIKNQTASTTKTVPSSSSSKTSTPLATETSQTTAKPVKECKALLGVTTCGSAEMRRNLVVILLSLTLFAAFAS